ncbi:tetratricopeptide repeat protein [Roseimaritima ulvae]|uniref:Tetratricopeptide repeat protein n=1 Tax=Roseimaritima ulvae TaxID=980254 RepID=A0A5B9QJ71_9BACT|nr:tetratricopeptide repeat protein [Roseimaritima ulvae]QEG38944.1 Tetratricopeptide repeat protein [Roseimaritima ulvae]
MIQKNNPRPRYGKRALLTVALLASTGCASGGGPSLASLNPFNKPASTAATATLQDEPSPGITDAVASTAQGARGQVSSMSAAVKSAYSKTTGGIAGLFNGNGGENTVDEAGNKIASDDPLNLSNKPESIGPEVYVANGQLWETSGNLDNAMEKYAKALEIEPTNAPALASIARLKFRQTQYTEAAEYFARATKAAPSDASLYNDWGLTLSKLGQHEEASKTIQKALAISPGTSRYANNLASVQYSAGNPEQALKTLQEHNKAAVAHFNMAYLEFNQGNYDKARVQLTEAIKFEPQAEEDSAVKRAVERSRELLAKLDGPAGQIANVAQAASQTYDAAQQLQQNGQPAEAQPPAAPTGATQAAATSPTASSDAPGTFSLPPDFNVRPAAQTAELPGTKTR